MKPHLKLFYSKTEKALLSVHCLNEPLFTCSYIDLSISGPRDHAVDSKSKANNVSPSKGRKRGPKKMSKKDKRERFKKVLDKLSLIAQMSKPRDCAYGYLINLKSKAETKSYIIDNVEELKDKLEYVKKNEALGDGILEVIQNLIDTL